MSIKIEIDNYKLKKYLMYIFPYTMFTLFIWLFLAPPSHPYSRQNIMSNIHYILIVFPLVILGVCLYERIIIISKTDKSDQ